MVRPEVRQVPIEVAITGVTARPEVRQVITEVGMRGITARPEVRQAIVEVAVVPPFASFAVGLALAATILPVSDIPSAPMSTGVGMSTTIVAVAAPGDVLAGMQGGVSMSATIQPITQNGVGAIMLPGLLMYTTIQATPGPTSGFSLGDGLPFGYPQDIEILMQVDPSSQLENVTDYVKRETISITRRASGGISSASFELRAEIGRYYQLAGLRQVQIRDPYRTYGGGRTHRLFGGWTDENANTQDGLDVDIPVRCVGFDRLLDYPPLNVSTAWPPSYDNAGTPVVATSCPLDDVAAGSNRVFHVVSSNNIYGPNILGAGNGGKVLTAVNKDGTHEERITISEVGVSGNGLTLRADFATSKTKGWYLIGGISDLEFLKDGWRGLLAKTTVIEPVTTLGVPIFIEPRTVVGIQEGEALICFNGNSLNSNYEIVQAVGVSGGGFNATFTSTKTANWRIHVLHTYRGLIDTFYNDTEKAHVTLGHSGGRLMVFPDSMENVVRGRTMWCHNENATYGGDVTAQEEVFVEEVGLNWFIATFLYPKTAGWAIHNGPWVSKAGVSKVIESLPHLRYSNTTPRKVAADLRTRNIDPAKAPRDFISFLEDAPDHLTVFGPIWVHYDALAAGELASVELTNYETIDPLTEAYMESYTLSRQASQRFNAIAVTGRNNTYGRYEDATAVLADGRVWEGETIHDNNITTTTECEERAEMIVRNYVQDRKTFHVTTPSEVDPHVLRQPLTVTLHDYSNGINANFPVASVTLSYDTQALRTKYTFELNDVPTDLDGQLMPFGLGKRPHATSSAVAQGSDYIAVASSGVPGGSQLVSYTDPEFALFDKHGHAVGYAPNRPMAYVFGTETSKPYEPIPTTIDYLVDPSYLNPGDTIMYIQLPPVSERPFGTFTFKKVDAGTNVVAFLTYPGETTDAPILTRQNQSIVLRNDAVNRWAVKASHGLTPELVAAGEFIIGDGNSVITTGDKGTIGIPFDCQLVEYTMWSDISGDISVDLLRAAYDDYIGWLATPWVSIPTNAGGALPQIITSTKMRDTVLLNWDTQAGGTHGPLDLLAGDIIKFSVVSANLVGAVTCVPWVVRL